VEEQTDSDEDNLVDAIEGEEGNIYMLCFP